MANQRVKNATASASVSDNSQRNINHERVDTNTADGENESLSQIRKILSLTHRAQQIMKMIIMIFFLKSLILENVLDLILSLCITI